MSDKNLASAEAYYEAMNSKDITRMKKYLDPKVQFVGAMTELKGRVEVLLATNSFIKTFKKLSIRAKFASENQVMLAYDLDPSEPIHKFRTAVLMSFKEELIEKIEFFYDGRFFQKNEIFHLSTFADLKRAAEQE